MPTGEKLVRKNAYMAKLVDLVHNSLLALIVDVDHVGSKQMQNIRIKLRGKSQLLMGKNTMIRTALRKEIERLGEEAGNEEKIEEIQRLVAAVNGNMGFIFCQTGDALEASREALDEFVVPAAAKAGTVAPKDVWIPMGPSGLEPSQTSFFQALNIPTKIVKGAIEITADFRVCTKGEKVSLSAQALLTKLAIKPFEYGMTVRQVYQDGSVFDAAVLDITDDVLVAKFMNGVANVAAFSREVGVPTEASLPHMMCNAFKNIVATVCDIDFTFEEVAEIKDILSDPDKLAAMKAGAAASAAAPAAGGAGGAAPAAAAAVEEEEEEEMEFDLF
jgi:large subunit ribosomal protein LP0